MSDSFTEVTTQGFGSRIMESIKGILIGIVLFLAAFPVLFINEGCSVKTYRKWKQAGQDCIALSEPKVQADHDGFLIHFTADATTDEILRDQTLGVDANAIRMERVVKMYQWKQDEKKETKKNTGGSKTTKTTYTYKKVWSPTLIDSSNFKKTGYENPKTMPYNNEVFLATNVSAGEFNLPSGLIQKITNSTTLAMDDELVQKLPEALRQKGKPSGDAFYMGVDPSSPQIGDVKISFEVVRPPQKVSIMAAQSGNTLQPYETDNGKIFRLDMGSLSKDEMVNKAQEENRIRTWVVRVIGFIMMAMGLGLVLKPLSVMADVVPFIGSMVGGGIVLVSVFVAFAFSLLTISLAWIFFRPLLGVPLLVVGLAILGFFIYKGITGRKPELEHAPKPPEEV